MALKRSIPSAEEMRDIENSLLNKWREMLNSDDEEVRFGAVQAYMKSFIYTGYVRSCDDDGEEDDNERYRSRNRKR